MKKGFWFGFTVAFASAILIGVLFKFWNSEDITKIISLYGVLVSTLTILFVVNNTNRQIKNQNKESHRPYITVQDIKLISHDMINDEKEFEATYQEEILSGVQIITKRVKESDDSHRFKRNNHINFLIIMKNIGYGIATNIKFLGINGTHLTYTKLSSEKVDVFSTMDLGLDEYKSINCNMTCKFEDKGTNFVDEIAHMLLFYTDLNGNIYSSLVNVVVTSDNTQNNNLFDFDKTIYSKGSRQFDLMLKKYGCDFQYYLDKYKEKMLSEENL